MSDHSYPAARHDYASDAEEMQRLEAAMDEAPRGAVAVAGIAVGLLLVCWFLVYALIFLPRGTVG